MTNNSERRPWFGPKRIGWGIRPQTWPGWMIVLAFAIIVTIIAVLAGH